MGKKSMGAALVGVVLMLAAGWAAAAEPNVGTPAFKNMASASGVLKYGFRGAAVYDKATKRWSFYSMTTITRHKVQGYVNQINNRLALAAGLHAVAVYDFRTHGWKIYRLKGSVDDSTGNLKKNFVLTDTFAKVKVLNGRYLRYANGAWSQVSR